MLKIHVVSVGRGTRGHVLASVKVQLTSEDEKDVVRILDVRVLRNRHGKLWVGYPNQAFPAPERKFKYVPTIDFSDELAQRISESVLDAYNGPLGSKVRVEAYED
jgi:hypothetical protein